MDIQGVIERTINTLLIDDEYGVAALRTINRIVPDSLKLEPDTATGRDIQMLFRSVSGPLHEIIASTDYQPEPLRKKQNYFPTVLVVLFISVITFTVMGMLVRYINTAKQTGYLPVSEFKELIIYQYNKFIDGEKEKEKQNDTTTEP